MSVTVKIDTSGIDAMFESIGLEMDDAVRPVAQAGAQVLYDAVKRNVANINSVSGNLDRSIYQVYSRDNSNQHRATYHISWNARKAPHGHLIEYGYWQRYRVYMKKDGTFETVKSQPLKEPRYIPGKAFVRSALMWSDKAATVMEERLFEILSGDYTFSNPSVTYTGPKNES